MEPIRALVVPVIAAIAASKPPRRPGIDAYVPAMFVSGLLLAMPVCAVLLVVIRVATRAHPLSGDPLLSVGLDSVIAGVIMAAEIIRRWQGAIEAELALYDALDTRERRRRRGRYLALGLLEAALLLAVLMAVLAAKPRFP